MLFILQHVSQFTAEGRLTRSLETRHQDDCRTVIELQLRGNAAHESSELIMHNLHHQLTWFHRC